MHRVAGCRLFRCGLAPHTSPKSLSGVFQEGTFFSRCQVVHLYFLHRSDGSFTSSRLSPLDYVLAVRHYGPWAPRGFEARGLSSIPVGTMCFRCVLGGSIGRVVDFWPSLPFSGSPRGLEARGLSRLLQSSQFGVTIIGGTLSGSCRPVHRVAGCRLFRCGLAPHTSPKSLSGGARGDFLLSVPGGPPIFFTSF